MSVLDRTADDDTAWKEWRKAGITATDIADAANGTYGGAYAVVARKLGLLEPDAENDQMRRGHRWQPVIADAVNVLTGQFVVGEESWCEHPDHPEHRATVDGFLAPVDEASIDDVSGVLEVKTRGVGTRPNRDRWTDQVQWQLWVTGQPRGVIAEAVIDDDTDTLRSLHLSEVIADPDRQATLVLLAGQLLVHLDQGTLPEPDTASALDAVKAVHAKPEPDPESVDLSDIADDVARFAAIKEAVKAVTDERDELEARIRDRVGDNTVGTCPGFTVSVSRPTMVLTADAEAELLDLHPELGRTVLDRAKAKDMHPDDLAAARRPVGARRLTLKETTR